MAIVCAADDDHPSLPCALIAVMNGEHTNAIAGPSTYNSIHPLSPSTLPHSSSSTAPHSSVPPLLFLPPPGILFYFTNVILCYLLIIITIAKGPPPPKQHLASTQDLLSRFHLLPAYNKYVRPSLLPGTDPSNEGALPSTLDASITPGTLDKGKGKEVVHGNAVTMGNTPVDMDLGDGGDGDDDDAAGGKGEKKKKNTYKHLIKGVPGVLLFLPYYILTPSVVSDALFMLTGKHSLKKDDSLTKVMLVPPKERMKIAHFDSRTQEDAFSVSLEGLKGVRSLLPLSATTHNLTAIVEYQHSCFRIGSGPRRPEKKGTFFPPMCHHNKPTLF